MNLFNALTSDFFDTQFDATPDDTIVTTKDAYIVTVDVPGIPKSAINLDLSNRSLIVSGERKHGNQSTKLRREFIVPTGTSPEDVSAACEDGVLTVKIAKPKQSQSTKIMVT